MNNLEIKNDILSPQENISDEKNDRLDFLNNENFSDIKEPLTKTITDLSNEHIVAEEDFWNNIEQVTKDIFNDPSFDAVFELKEQQANNIYIFRSKFKEIKKNNEEIKTEEQEKQEINISNQKEETNNKTEEYNNKTEEVINNSISEIEKDYVNIDNKYKPTENQLETFKKEDTKVQKIIENENFKNLLPEKKNLYLSYRFAGEQIAKESLASKDKTISRQNYEFIQKFNKLDTNLGLGNPIDVSDFSIIENNIDEENDNGEKNSIPQRSMEDITDNDNLGNELVEYNTDIQDFVLDEKTNTVNTEEIRGNAEVQHSIGNKLNDWYKEDIQKGINKLLHKNKLDKYESNFDESGNIVNENSIPKEDLKKLNKIQEATTKYFTKKATEKIAEDTNQAIKMKAVGALLQNIGQYFKIDNFAQDFTIDLKSGIAFDQKELKLSGNMEGTQMAFYCDMNTGEVYANDTIHHNTEDKTFYLDRGNKDSKGRERLPLKMTTLASALNDSKKIHLQAVPDLIQQSNNLEEYGKNIKEIPFSIDSKSDIADIVIEHSMAKNIAMQETQDFLKKYIPTKNSYSKDKEQSEYNLYKIVDTSFDRYSADEIKQRRNLIARFDNKISEEDQNFQDEMVQGMFNQKTRKEDTQQKYDISQGPNMYQFMRAMTHEQAGTIKNEVINLNLFQQVVQTLEKEDGNTKKLINKSAKYEKLRADWESKKDRLDAENMDLSQAYNE